MASDPHTNIPARFKTWNFPLIMQGWIFFLVILFFQLIWENFENEIDTFPPLAFISDSIGGFLLTITPKIVNPFVEGDIIQDGTSLILPNGLYINYFFSLSGVKQMCLVISLIVIAQGAWKKKAWFIPFALIIIQITVLVRFFVLTLNCTAYPERLNLLKNVFFAPLFYFEILIIWMVWVLLIAKTASLRNYNSSSKKS